MRAKAKSGVRQQDHTINLLRNQCIPHQDIRVQSLKITDPFQFPRTLPMQHALTWANDNIFLASRHKRNVKGVTSLSFYVVLSSVKGILQKLQSSIICIGQRKTLI